MLDPAPLRRRPRARAGRRRRRARRRPRVAAARGRAGVRRRLPLLRHACATTSPTRGPDASDDEVAAAARAPGSTSSSTTLPDGYDTLVGERGLTLSGGQRQRVAIARALLADPRILILDDATSSVDATTESRIKDALREVMEGRTTFVIAHRLSTIALADEIVVLEDGAIVARGTHDELLEDSRALPRDRREGPARPGVPDPRRGRARGGGPVRRALGDPPRRAAAARASCGTLADAAAPVPRRGWSSCSSRSLLATAAALAPPYLAGRRDRRRHPRRRLRRAHRDR